MVSYSYRITVTKNVKYQKYFIQYIYFKTKITDKVLDINLGNGTSMVLVVLTATNVNNWKSHTLLLRQIKVTNTLQKL